MTKDKECPICNNQAHYHLTKQDIDYHICTNCKMVFCDELDNDNLIGGGAEIERNTQQNHLRIARIDEMCRGMKKEDVFIMDWGCGHGLFVEDLRNAGYTNTFGYDLYNPEFQKIPTKETYHIVTSIECFEHMAGNYIDIKGIYRCLKLNALCYIETGFLDATRSEGVEDEDNPYINPAAGHSTIFTHHAMDVLMCTNNFVPMQKFNRHAHLYQKK